MPLLTINDPERVLAEAEDGPQGLPLVRMPNTGFDRCVLKLKKYGCCEVLGYLLAQRLEIPVMPYVSFRCPRAFHYRGASIGDGRIGLAVQYVDKFCPITLEQAISQAPDTVASSMVLCLLDRHEWGDFAMTPNGLVFYDLERLFPAFCPERSAEQTWDHVADRLKQTAESYARVVSSLVDEANREAARVGLAELFRCAVCKAATISPEELRRLFDLRPHPLAEQMAGIAASVATEQFRCASRALFS